MPTLQTFQEAISYVTRLTQQVQVYGNEHGAAPQGS